MKKKPKTSLTDWDNLRPDGTRHRKVKPERDKPLTTDYSYGGVGKPPEDLPVPNGWEKGQ